MSAEKSTAHGVATARAAARAADAALKAKGSDWLALYVGAYKATKHDLTTTHPIAYAAGVLFDNGETEIAWQLKGLEYGCTLDPVSLLAQPILKRGILGVRPVLIVQCDQVLVFPPLVCSLGSVSQGIHSFYSETSFHEADHIFNTQRS